MGLHWFDPFGSVDFSNICNFPPVDGTAEQRLIFWDQEPLYNQTISSFFKQFCEIYQGPRTIVTSEFDSDMVRWACDTYGLDSSYYFFHAWASLDWYRGYNRTFLLRRFRDRHPSSTFLCLNNIIGGHRKHRLELLSELVDRELIANNLVSFPNSCPYEKKSVAELCLEYQVDLGHVDLPLVVDQEVNHAGNSHRIDLWPFADQTLLQVVTETVYLDHRQHLTEKTFKAIVMQQPFVLVSCRGSLEYLRRYGFKTFGEFWDESYDDADDDVRIIKIGKLLNDLDNLSTQEKQQLQRALVSTVEHNFNWFYSREFENLLWQELTDMISTW